MNRIVLFIITLSVSACTAGTLKNKIAQEESKTELRTNAGGTGPEIKIDFTRGPSFYYPLFAIWLEDEKGNYIQTLYVSKSVATGIFKYGKQENNKWVTAQKRAPQTLPYWAHKRDIKASDGLYMPDSQTAVPDAYTGATPVKGFILTSHADKALPLKFRVMLEINQNWDWNEYWTNDKYPDDENYKMSCQPAVVYAAEIDTSLPAKEYIMEPIGHSHYSGKTGELFTDMSTLTTALDIAGSVRVYLK